MPCNRHGLCGRAYNAAPSLRQAGLTEAFHVSLEDERVAIGRALAPLSDGELRVEADDLPRRRLRFAHHPEMRVVDSEQPLALGRIVHAHSVATTSSARPIAS